MTSESPSKQSKGTSRLRDAAVKEALPALICAVSGVLCYGLFFGRGLGLSVIGYSISPAQRVLQGEIPYRDFLFNYTPGVLWINALLMKAFGPTLMPIRAGLFAFKLITLVLVFLVSRRFTSAWAALVPVSLTLAWLGHRQVFNVYPDQYLMLFALLAIGFMLDHHESGRTRYLLLCGLATGVVFLFKHNVGVFLIAAGIVSISLRQWMTAREEPRSRGSGRVVTSAGVFLAGVALIAGSLAAYLLYHHALAQMVEHFLNHAAEYGASRAIALPPPSHLKAFGLAVSAALGAAALVLYRFPKLLTPYLIAVITLGSAVLLIPGRAYSLKESAVAAVAYLPILVFGASAAPAFVQIRKAIKRDGDKASWWRRHGSIVILGLFSLGVYLEVFPRADSYHLVRVLPVVLLFLFVLLIRSQTLLSDYLGRRVAQRRQACFLVLALPICFLFAAGLLDTWVPQFAAGLHLKDNTPLTFEAGRGILVEKRQAELAEGLVSLIQTNSDPTDSILSFSQRGSSLYFLAARKNPSRLLWWSSVGIKEEDREAVMTLVRTRVPKLIVLQDVSANKTIRDFVCTYYNHVGTVTDIAVYHRIQ